MKDNEKFSLTKEEFNYFVDVFYARAGVGRPPQKGNRLSEYTFHSLSGSEIKLNEMCSALAVHDSVLAEKVRVFFDASLKLVQHVDSRVSG